jgi:hypothetical protein
MTISGLDRGGGWGAPVFLALLVVDGLLGGDRDGMRAASSKRSDAYGLRIVAPLKVRVL